MNDRPTLARRLGLLDAVVIGLGSMIGAGIFASFAPAAAAAGAGLLVGLALAAVVAFCNATASAQLAAQYPMSGGTYVYGRERLGHWAGFMAGWSFVVGKTASCAAMALTFATYAAPVEYTEAVAVAAVLALTTVNYFGVTRTAAMTKVVVAIVLLVLAAVVWMGVAGTSVENHVDPGLLVEQGWYGILQSAGLLFFAFAGYARIATMGEEVVRPARTIPRAIVVSLIITLIVYAAVAFTVLATLGPDRLAASTAPLVEVVIASGHPWAAPMVRIGAAVAALGALLALIAGVGRTSLAMARHADLPRWLGAVHSKYAVPHRAEATLAAVVCVLVVSIDLRDAIGFSSFGVLFYYFIANVSGYTQSCKHRRYPRVLQIIGMAGCLLLAFTLPVTSIAVGVGVLAAGVAYRLFLRPGGRG
ncbi:MAG: APC family permease [Rhodococcus sp. (in: high G+C Gram-positive bacteria)]